jgi:hypothetical protein
VWFLPSWTPDSGGELGGAVTVGQLHFAAARASQAIAIVAMLALAFVAVPSTGWLRLADATWGRASRIWGPVLCLPDAVVDQQREALLVRRFGLAGASGRTSLVDTVDRARELSDRWHAARSSSGRPRAVRGLLGLVILVAAALWWAVSSIDPATRLDVTGTERTLLALAAFGLVAVMLRRSGVPRPTPGDVVPLVGALAMAAAWFGRDLTGEAADLVVDFAALPPLPLAVLAAAAVLPIVAAAAGGSR